MSEADVIRGHIISDAEAIDGEWGCVHEWADMTPKCAGYADAVAALAALDSLTTQLTQAREALEEAVAHALHVEERNNDIEAERDTLRSQLTQAREALERIARVPLEEDDYVPDGTMQNIASEALATMNEGERG